MSASFGRPQLAGSGGGENGPKHQSQSKVSAAMEKTWVIPKMNEPGPGSYAVEEAIKVAQWPKIKGHTRQIYEPGTWINPKEQKLAVPKPEIKPSCVKDHKWGSEEEHDKLFNTVRNKISKDNRLIFKRH